jgi:hypothetical protein
MGTISAARGVLAAAYTTGVLSPAAAAVYGQTGEESCPCTVFQTSTDYGRTWRRHIVLGSHPFEEAQDVVSAYVAADPSRSNRYAVGIIEAKGTRLKVYVTNDAGTRFRSSFVEPKGRYLSNRPWVSYGADGALGVMWRRDYHYQSDCQMKENQLGFQHCPYDVFVNVSPTGKAVFGPAVRLTKSPTRASDSYAAGDDISHAVVANGRVYATWGDWRRQVGDMDAWLGSYRYTR